MVETVSKASTAEALNRCYGLRESGSPLRVMVQVNNTNEESESHSHVNVTCM